jgi:uncharacterized protein involved in exopolysaccharide biosynthesis
MSLKQVFTLLWNNKVVIILTPLLVAGFVLLLTANMSRQYESTAVVFTEPKSNRGETAGGVERIDFYTSNNLFDNLMLLMRSRETLNEASLKLLALHLSTDGPNPNVLSQQSFTELQEHISPALKQELGVSGDPRQTYLNLVAFHESYPDSVVDYLLREHPHYGFEDILDNLFVARRSSSDMMEVKLKSDDPAVCYYSLKYIVESFMDRYGRLKEQENINSIQYFEEQLRLSQDRLIASELQLKEFISTNQILNYYEQGKYLDVAQMEQDQDEERALRLAAGTKANLDQMEEVFSNFGERQEAMNRIDSLQSELTKKRMALEGINAARPVNTEAGDQLMADIDDLRISIERATEALVSTSTSAQGIPRKNILDEWLRLNIQYQEQIEAIEVMKNRKEQLNQKITQFAPLGAELTRLEREVEVNENQYLSLLHGLNQARLRQYDLETSSSQTLIDEPLFPKKPLPSKRRILVAGGVLGTGFMILSGLFLIALLDSTVKSAQRATSLTGLSVVGGWPAAGKSGRGASNPILHKRLIKQLYNQIMVYLHKDQGKNTILFYSIESGEGKTFLINKLVEELVLQEKTVTVIHPEGSPEEISSGNCQYLSYPEDGLADLHWQQLIEKAEGEMLLFEHPNIQLSNIHFHLMNHADLNIFVMDASKPWSNSDLVYLENVKKGMTKPHVIWLNKMIEEDLEDINGIIPKKRSKLRSFVKRLLA